MGMVPVYRSGVSSGTTLRQVPASQSNGLAEGLSVLGRVGAQAAARSEQVDEAILSSEDRVRAADRRRRQQQATMEHARRLAEAQVGLADQIATLEREPAAGAEGHEEAVRTALDDQWRELASALPADDRELFETARTQFTEFAARSEIRAGAFAAAHRSKLAGDNFEAMVTAQGRMVYTDPSPATLELVLGQQQSFIEAMPIGDDKKAALIEEARKNVVTSMATGALDGGSYDALEAAMQDPMFAANLGGAEDLSRWRGRINAGRASEQAAQEAQANEARRAALEGLSLLEVQMENGDFRGGVGDVNAAIAAARAAGVPASELAEFGYMADAALRGQAVQGLPVEALEAEQARLEQLIATGSATRAERGSFDAVEAELKYRDREAGGGISELLEGGAAGVAQAADQIGAMASPERRWAAAREANRPELAVYANMAPGARRQAAEGAGMRRERADDFLPGDGRTRGSGNGTEAVQTIFRQLVGERIAMQLVRSETYNATMNAALDLMASRAGRWDAAQFAQAVHEAAGGSARRDGTRVGGIGRLRGGVTVELPAQWSADDFDRQWRAQAFEGARYSDGREVNAEDVRAHFTPVFVGSDPTSGDSLYQLEDATGGRLRMGDAGLFQLRLRRRPSGSNALDRTPYSWGR